MEMYPRGHKPESTIHNENVMRFTNEDVSFLIIYFKFSLYKSVTRIKRSGCAAGAR